MRGSADFDGLGLRPPLNKREVGIHYVNEHGSLVKKSAKLGHISICGDTFTVKLEGKTTYDTVVAVRAHHGHPHHWALINRSTGRPDLIVKYVDWHPHYHVRFDGRRSLDAGQMSLGV